MKTDIFEDMKERVGCENISDLPYRKRMVWEIIKQHSPLDYPKEQLEKFSHYVFGVDYEKTFLTVLLDNQVVSAA